MQHPHVRRPLIAAACAAFVLAAGTQSASAAIIRISEAAFTAGAGLITFSEKPLGTLNPIYAPGDYGGGVGSPTVTFEGYFMGQMLGASSPPCPAGAALSGCVLGSPTSPLTLDPSAPNTFITTDGANPSSPVLSGSPTFNGPVAILFSLDVAGVGLDGGFFNAIGGTSIKAFDRTGAVIGEVTNTGLGIEFLGLVTSDKSETIAGLLFSLVGPEPAGFAIDNVRFGAAKDIRPPVPEPTSVALFGLGLLGVGILRRRAR